jgi:hypothetical protein
MKLVGLFVCFHATSKAVVAQLQITRLGQKHIGWLDVAVNHTPRVRVFQRKQQLVHEPANMGNCNILRVISA